VRATASAKHDTEELTALVALHDGAQLAMRAVEMLGDDRVPETAAARHPLLSPLDTDAVAKWTRVASTDPVVVLGMGAAARVLARNGPVHAREAARAWAALGNAPIDVVAPGAP
jgi:hypothetical protein